MTALIEKIKKFFEGWCPCCSNKTVQSTDGQENRLQQKESQPKVDQPDVGRRDQTPKEQQE